MTVGNDKEIDPKVKISALRKALPQIIAVSVKNVLLLGFGMTLGFPTILIPGLSGENPDEKISLGQDAISWIGSVNLLCVPLGCLLSGVITQPLGRRRAMQFVTLPFLAAWLLFYCSRESWHVFLALCMTGVTGGLLEAPVLTYVAEITEPSIRGALSSTSTMSINLGILVSFLLGTFLKWRTVALANACVPFVAFTLLLFIPESPYWLISRDRSDAAKKSLAWLRGWTNTDNINEEYEKIAENLINNPMRSKCAGENMVIEQLKMYLKPNFVKPFLLIALVFATGHFGNSPITVYAIKIFDLLQVPVSPYHATIYIGLVQLLAVTVCVFSIKYIGKRRLVGISLIGVSLSFLASGVYSYIYNVTNFNSGPQNDLQQNLSWISLATLIAQAFFSYLCVKGLPWILIGELYSNDVRASASGFSAAMGYVFGFLANKTFLDLVNIVSMPGVLWIYSVVAILGLVLLYFLLPETEGKSLIQITEHYAGGKKLDNKVYKNRKTYRAVNKAFEKEIPSEETHI